MPRLPLLLLLLLLLLPPWGGGGLTKVLLFSAPPEASSPPQAPAPSPRSLCSTALASPTITRAAVASFMAGRPVTQTLLTSFLSLADLSSPAPPLLPLEKGPAIRRTFSTSAGPAAVPPATGSAICPNH